MLIKPKVTRCNTAGSHANELSIKHKALHLLNKCLWIICASTSALTSRSLLVDLNFHFPAHLCLLQVVASFGVSYLYSQWVAITEESAEIGTLKRNGLLLHVTCFFMAMNVVLLPQAILHVPNASMLAMISVSQFEQFLTLDTKLT
jgi:hypothetical protein